MRPKVVFDVFKEDPYATLERCIGHALDTLQSMGPAYRIKFRCYIYAQFYSGKSSTGVRQLQIALEERSPQDESLVAYIRVSAENETKDPAWFDAYPGEESPSTPSTIDDIVGHLRDTVVIQEVRHVYMLIPNGLEHLDALDNTTMASLVTMVYTTPHVGRHEYKNGLTHVEVHARSLETDVHMFLKCPSSTIYIEAVNTPFGSGLFPINAPNTVEATLAALGPLASEHVERANIRGCTCTVLYDPEDIDDSLNRTFSRTDALFEDLMAAAWHPSRHIEWCLSQDEKYDLTMNSN